jgi:DNA-binding GntR family transcriptional regulator
MLQVEGLIVATPNRGATVRVHTPDDLDDLYVLRRCSKATRSAAPPRG